MGAGWALDPRPFGEGLGASAEHGEAASGEGTPEAARPTSTPQDDLTCGGIPPPPRRMSLFVCDSWGTSESDLSQSSRILSPPGRVLSLPEALRAHEHTFDHP